MDNTFFGLLEEVMYGVEGSNKILADYYKEFYPKETKTIQSLELNIIPVKLKNLYFDTIYPDTKNPTDEEFVKILHCKDKDKIQSAVRNCTPFQKEIFRAFNFLKYPWNTTRFLFVFDYRIDNIENYEKKIKILKLLGYNTTENEQFLKNEIFKRKLIKK